MALLVATPPTVASDANETKTLADAQNYVKNHPFDFVGYISLSEEILGGNAQKTEASKIDQSLSIAQLLAPFDPLVIRAAFRNHIARGDQLAALESVSQLLDRSPSDRGDALDAITTLSASSAWAPFVKKKLASDWSNADVVVRHLCDRNVAVNQVLLLAHQIAVKRPLQADALHCVEYKLVQANAIDVAYYLHMASNRPSVPIAFVNNGEFDRPSTGSPFDWQLGQSGAFRSGFDVSLKSGTDFGRPGGKLSIRFNGRAITQPIATQYLALLPGTYALEYLVLESGGYASGAANLTLGCRGTVQKSIPLEWRRDANATNWARVSTRATIPPGCSGQVLALQVESRLSSLEGLKGTLLVDAIELRRL
ncbi:MAG: hypothetical protein ACRCWJ_19555 [Casimicrobium sp.]